MDDDENISTIVGMGFHNLEDVKRALRIAKNDINEAVTFLMDQNPSYSTDGDYGLDYELSMKAGAESDNGMEFPMAALYELESRVFQTNWSIPYKKEESLGRCLEAAIRLAHEGLLEQDEASKKFIDQILPEAFRKLMTSNATHRWLTEIQEGIFSMNELFVDLVAIQLKYEAVPEKLLVTLALIFDMKNDWNSKNKDQESRGTWENEGEPRITYAEPLENRNNFQCRMQFGWLCDLINQFGNQGGFKNLAEKFKNPENQTARMMTALLAPLANCAPLLVSRQVHSNLSGTMDVAFKYTESVGESELKSKDINYLFDLCQNIKLLCDQVWPQHVELCDTVRLDIVFKMISAHHFNCRMAGLKELSRIIEEVERSRTRTAISGETVLEWLSEKKILSVVLEGNIDQVQYTDRIKAIVEFLGQRLSEEELTNIWNLGEGENSHVIDNVHGILAAASSKFSLAQFEFLSKLIKEKWSNSDEKVQEKLIKLIGRIGKESVHAKTKAVQNILQLLWEMAHDPELPRHLTEQALGEHLNTLLEININRDAIRRQYVMSCVDDIKKFNHNVVTSILHLHHICKSYGSKGSSSYQKATKQTLSDLNKQHEIVKLMSNSLKKTHMLSVTKARESGVNLHTDFVVQQGFTHRECVDAHLDLMMFLLKDGDLYLSWARCEELWSTLIDNPDAIPNDRDQVFRWFTQCISDLEIETQKRFFCEKLLQLPCASVSTTSFTCVRSYFESVNNCEGGIRKLNGAHWVEQPEALIGVDFFWDLLVGCGNEEIAGLAIKQILDTSYLQVAQKLKKEPVNLHNHFIEKYFDRLHVATAHLVENLADESIAMSQDCDSSQMISSSIQEEDECEGLEIETAVQSHTSSVSMTSVKSELSSAGVGGGGSPTTATEWRRQRLSCDNSSPRNGCVGGGKQLPPAVAVGNQLLSASAASPVKFALGSSSGGDSKTQQLSDQQQSPSVPATTVTSTPAKKTTSLTSKRVSERQVRRLLQLAERYLLAVEVLFDGARRVPPHAASFYGRPLKINVKVEPKKDEFTIQSHTNEPVSEVKRRIGQRLNISNLESMSFVCLGSGSMEEVALENIRGKDARFMFQVGDPEGQTWKVKTTSSSTIGTEVVLYEGDSSSRDKARTPSGKTEAILEEADSSSSEATSSNNNNNNNSNTWSGRSGTPRPDSGASSSNKVVSSSRAAYDLEEEKNLPGVLLASDGKIFSVLYALSRSDNSSVLAAIRRLIHLIPTDSELLGTLDGVLHVTPSMGADASPKMSPRVKKSFLLMPKHSDSCDTLSRLLDATAPGMTPMRVLYNLEAISSRIMPPAAAASPGLAASGARGGPGHRMASGAEGDNFRAVCGSTKFAEDFIKAGGLRLLLNVLEKDTLPTDVDYDIRQSAYLVALQLGGYLLCGQTVLNPSTSSSEAASSSSNSTSSTSTTFVAPSSGMALFSSAAASSSTAKPTPPKKSALDCSLDMKNLKSPIALSACRIVQTMSEYEFVDLLSCLMRVVWAAAAGKLYLASMGIQAAPKPERVYAGRRSRDSSTGSSNSIGSSEGGSVAPDQSLHAGVCAQQSTVSAVDCQIAGEAFELLVTCLSLRQNLINKFFELPSVSDFIIDTVLGSPSQVVRMRAAEQLIRLSQIRKVSRSLYSTGEGDGSKDVDPPAMEQPGLTVASNSMPSEPKLCLLQVLLRTPVPLWVPSCKSRSSSHQIISSCGEYMELRSKLLEHLTTSEQEFMRENCEQMVEDEMTWLLTFSPCNRVSDSALLAGHIKVVKSLLSCHGVSKRKVGDGLIPYLMTHYLFPASVHISERGLANSLAMGRDIRPICDTEETRLAGYDLLTELSRGCADNLSLVVKNLIKLHHQHDSNLVTEHQFEFEPAIDRRADCNFVGLKNAGATCYMNSVLQQLYCLPGAAEKILAVNLDQCDEETAFYQLQSVFAHLLESKLQYYVPDKFWKCFKLWGEPVNVREQQDACEFFIQVVDQVDEYLMSLKREPIFSRIFEGTFSDQKICEDCPHRYEREQKFIALSLDVKPGNLEESLTQYVKGERLEGDNAYYCEKCAQKRNSVKRMCIKRLPSTLVIQLNRFHYDLEANRSIKFDDYFQFPWTLDMGPYTAEGILAKEDMKRFQAKLNPSLQIKNSIRTVSYIYDLVGVVVHSGQANAGHYYSFVKDRKGHSAVNPNKNKWFKFNDTTVEEMIPMNQETLEAETFGGKFRVKKKEGSGGNANASSGSAAASTSTSGGTQFGPASSLPEERQRYWNAYILLYEARRDDGSAMGRGGGGGALNRAPKKSFSGTTALSNQLSGGGGSSTGAGTSTQCSGAGNGRSRSGGPMTRRQTLPSRISELPPMSGTESQVRESLSELSDLLERGEKEGLFSSRMPPSIERGIREDNLRFMQNKDIYTSDYYKFVYNLVTSNRRLLRSGIDSLAKDLEVSDKRQIITDSLNLAVNFMFNTYFHIKRRSRDVISEWIDGIEDLITPDFLGVSWLLEFLATDASWNHYVKPYILECPHRDIRSSFSELLVMVFSAFKDHQGRLTRPDKGKAPKSFYSEQVKADLKKTEADLTKILRNMVHLLDREVSDNRKHCSQYFRALAAFAHKGPAFCKKLFELGCFKSGIRFLLGLPADHSLDAPVSSSETDGSKKPRKWTGSEIRELYELHSLLAFLILAVSDPSGSDIEAYPKRESFAYQKLLSPSPPEVCQLMNGPLLPLYIMETINLCREISSCNESVVEMLIQISYQRRKISLTIIEELMTEYNTVPSSELKNLSLILVELMSIEDEFQPQRVTLVVEGRKGSNIDGLLDIIQNNQNTDSCRSYQAIKCLVIASGKSAVVKEHLVSEATRWQWAVNWLKSKMESNYWSPSNDQVVSNEDSTSRTFHRTQSAQVTLAEANRMLAEFDNSQLMDTEDSKTSNDFDLDS